MCEQTVVNLEMCAGIRARIRDAQITADEVRAFFEQVVASETALKAELGKMTIAALKTAYRLSRETTKKECVSGAFNRIIEELYWPAEGSLSWYPMQEQFIEAVRRHLKQLTDQNILDYSTNLKKKRQILVQAVTDPQTLSDFQTYLHARDLAPLDLDDEKLARYDYLVADDQLTKAENLRASKARIEKIESLGDEIGLSIKESVHTKKQVPIWIVQISDRVERPVYDELSRKALKLGGRWSSFGPKDTHGFVFYAKEDAEAFVALTESDGSAADRQKRREREQQESVAERFAQMSQEMEDRANAIISADRQVNTQRRIRFAMAAEGAANRMAHIGGIMSRIAEALEAGELRYLQHVRHATHIFQLEALLSMAVFNRWKKEKPKDWNYERNPTLDDVRYVEWPVPVVHLSELMRWKKVRGAKMAADSILKHWTKGESFMALRISDISALETIMGVVTGDDKRLIAKKLEESNRLIAMRLNGISLLRAALREYFGYRTDRVAGIDKIRLMEYNLVGKKIEGFVPTPIPVVGNMMDSLGDIEGALVLEPEAGSGRIADAMRERGAIVHCLEVDPTLRELLQAKGHQLMGYDFLEFFPEEKYDAIAMNPPFENLQDIRHVRHAYEHCLKDGRAMSAIMGTGFTFRQDKIAVEFREWLETVSYEQEELPAGTFRESNTNVPAIRLTIYK